MEDFFSKIRNIRRRNDANDRCIPACGSVNSHAPACVRVHDAYVYVCEKVKRIKENLT